MHLLAAKPGAYIDEDGIVDLQQSPASIVILSAADSSLGAIAKAVDSVDTTLSSQVYVWRTGCS